MTKESFAGDYDSMRETITQLREELQELISAMMQIALIQIEEDSFEQTVDCLDQMEMHDIVAGVRTCQDQLCHGRDTIRRLQTQIADKNSS